MSATSSADATDRVAAIDTIGAVLFDAAGTLIELRSSPGKTYARIAAVHGVALPVWRLEDAFARVLGSAEPMVFPEAIGDEARAHACERAWWRDVVRSTFLAADSTIRFTDFEAFFAELWEHFAAPGSWLCRSGVRATLPALIDCGLALGIASNFDHRLLRILEDLEISSFFQTIQIPSSLGSAKPDPALLQAAVDDLGVEPDATVYVGDSPSDAQAAEAAGVGYVWASELASLAELPERLSALDRIRLMDPDRAS